MKVLGYYVAGAALLLAAYSFIYFRRILDTLGLDVNRLIMIVLCAAAALATGHHCAAYDDGKALFLYLVIFLDLLMLLADRILYLANGREAYAAGFLQWKKVFGSGLVPLLLTAVIFFFGWINMKNVRETPYTVTTEKLTSGESFRVCLIGDVHYGVSLDLQEIGEVCREISAKKPDAVILCGDIVDNASEKEEIPELFGLFASIETSCGVFFVYGNHDRSTADMESSWTDDWLADTIEKAGIRILQDETVQLSGKITLAGREDRGRGVSARSRASAEELLSGIPKEQFILAADHQPGEYAELAAAGADLVLNGHTHGGQIFPADIITKMKDREHAVSGRYLITQKKNRRAAAAGPAKQGEGTATAIVTSGFGGWAYPIRTIGHSEYCMIEITGE